MADPSIGQDIPPQHQDKQPGIESEMTPRPIAEDARFRGRKRLPGKAAIITGGDSGIGRAVAIAFAQEGADVAIIYLDEHDDARETAAMVAKEGRRCMSLSGDVGDEDFCREAVRKVVDTFGRLDILVNNAALQFYTESIADVSEEQLERTFRTNIFSYFFMARAALEHLKEGGVIINTTSVTAYKGKAQLLDYSTTKGAIVSFTRSLALSLADKKIRVNGVAPGPVWTPLIPASFPSDYVEQFGKGTPLKRPAQPEEIAPCYVFLASDDSSYMTGQVLHPNGGEIVNG